jgi:hypothetical protein
MAANTSLIDKFFGGPSPLPDAGTPGLIKPASILELIGLKQTRNIDAFVETKDAVQDSRDIHRVLELPRRPRPTDFDTFRNDCVHLRRPNPACVCRAKYGRACAIDLKDLQAWALHEIKTQRGLVGAIPVGEGKTLIDLLALMVLGVKVGVLLIPANLREQLFNVDWGFYGQHWELPNLGNGQWFDPKKPTLHVVAYSELSSPRNSDILDRINPDVVIADEAHHVRNADAARTKRFKRFFSSHPACLFCCWSGTLTTRSLKDYAHLSNLALKDGSPTPLHWPTVEEWAGALDPSDWPRGLGALSALCRSGEPVRDGYRRRFEDTAGVVSSSAAGSCGASLVFSERKVVAPDAVHKALADLYSTWTRPDGEELVNGLEVFRVAKEISSGFYYRWRWPRQEPEALIRQWLLARREWHKEMREKLKHSREFMDSPLLLAKAAIRWHDGYTHRKTHTHDESCWEFHCDHEDGEHDYDCYTKTICDVPEDPGAFIPPHTKGGPQPVWDSATFPAWRAIRDQCQPETEAVWIDDFLARDAAAWCQSNAGICWYEHDVFGRRVAEIAQRPFYGSGSDASAGIISERGDRGIVASIRAHGTGKNLQCFARNLVANLPSDGAQWEQLAGRTHRPGQLADEVTFEVYRHTPVVIEALAKAKMLASYLQDMTGPQKLLQATYLF